MPTPPDEHGRILEQFLAALAADDAPGVLALLAPEVSMASDGGGRAAAARNVLVGPDRVARLLLGVTRKFSEPERETTYRLTTLNGERALLTLQHGELVSAMTVELDGGRIRAVHIMRNPDKLRHALDPIAPIA